MSAENSSKSPLRNRGGPGDPPQPQRRSHWNSIRSKKGFETVVGSHGTEFVPWAFGCLRLTRVARPPLAHRGSDFL